MKKFLVSAMVSFLVLVNTSFVFGQSSKPAIIPVFDWQNFCTTRTGNTENVCKKFIASKTWNDEGCKRLDLFNKGNCLKSFAKSIQMFVKSQQKIVVKSVKDLKDPQSNLCKRGNCFGVDDQSSNGKCYVGHYQLGVSNTFTKDLNNDKTDNTLEEKYKTCITASIEQIQKDKCNDVVKKQKELPLVKKYKLEKVVEQNIKCVVKEIIVTCYADKNDHSNNLKLASKRCNDVLSFVRQMVVRQNIKVVGLHEQGPNIVLRGSILVVNPSDVVVSGINTVSNKITEEVQKERGTTNITNTMQDNTKIKELVHTLVNNATQNFVTKDEYNHRQNEINEALKKWLEILPTFKKPPVVMSIGVGYAGWTGAWYNSKEAEKVTSNTMELKLDLAFRLGVGSNWLFGISGTFNFIFHRIKDRYAFGFSVGGGVWWEITENHTLGFFAMYEESAISVVPDIRGLLYRFLIPLKIRYRVKPFGKLGLFFEADFAMKIGFHFNYTVLAPHWGISTGWQF